LFVLDYSIKKGKDFRRRRGQHKHGSFLGYLIKTILETGQLGYILFFSVYGIDAVITIFG
jgi:hypothetical protein